METPSPEMHPESGATEETPQPSPEENIHPTSAPSWIKGLQSFTGPWTRENLFGWLKVILVVLILRWAWFEPFIVPSGSMEPTLHGEGGFFRADRIAANKYIYGLRVPFMNKRLFNIKDPQRWDIVVLKAVEPNAQFPTLVKRIVGLPGERIQIRNGHIYVNGEYLPLPPYMPNVYYVNDDDRARQIMQMPFLEDRITMQQIREKYPLLYGCLPDEQYAVVPKNGYLMLGDNSANSVDGRVWGWVPRDHVVGRVFCIWWPPSRWRDFTGFSRQWYGMSILYGVPGLFVFYELMQIMRRRRQQAAGIAPGVK